MSINYCALNTDPAAIARTLKDPSITMSLFGEDHTMGNALRAMLSSRADVSFAGYSIPHPTQKELNFRLQTVGPKYPAVVVFEQALEDLAQIAKHSSAQFEAALTAAAKNSE